MKILFLVRHAKAIGHDQDIDDYDRTLSERGINDAHKVARKFHAKEENPSLMISSPAARALHTAIIYCKVLRHPLEKLVLREPMYDASAEDLLDIVKKTDNHHQSLMLFGHNPEFAQLAEDLSTDFDEHLPTSGTVKITFHVEEWQQITDGTGLLEQFYTR